MKHNLRGPSGRFISRCIYPNGCFCKHHVTINHTKKHRGRCTSECDCSCMKKLLKPQKVSASQGEKELYVVARDDNSFRTLKEAKDCLSESTGLKFKEAYYIYRVTKKYRVIQESKIVEEIL